METEVEEKSEWMETVIAILIALVAVVGALVSWRASVVDDAAGDADYGGLRAAVNAEETRAINYVNAYESYGNYVTYWRNFRTASLIQEELADADEVTAEVLTEQMKVSNDLADANRTMFETRFLNRDGSYNVQRQLGEMWADASRQKDMEYQAQFDEADKLRTKSNRMLFAVMILGVSLVFYSLIEALGDRFKYLLAAAGTLCFIGGGIMALLIELGKI